MLKNKTWKIKKELKWSLQRAQHNLSRKRKHETSYKAKMRSLLKSGWLHKADKSMEYRKAKRMARQKVLQARAARAQARIERRIQQQIMERPLPVEG